MFNPISSPKVTPEFSSYIEDYIINKKYEKCIKEIETSDDKAMPFQHRIMFHDVNLQDYLTRIFETILTKYNVNICSSFSYVQYEVGGYICSHRDKYIDNIVSYTMMIYLNNDYIGGETYAEINGKRVYVNKSKNNILLFSGSTIKHGCRKVRSGCKKILLCKLYKKV